MLIMHTEDPAGLQLDGAKQPRTDPAGWQPAGCQA